MENEQVELKQEEDYPLILQPAADLIHNCILFLTSPIFTILSIASDSYQRAERTAEAVETTVMHKVPSKISHGSVILLKKLGSGLAGAFQVCMGMVFLVVLASVLGVLLVEMWVEEPVFVRERLFFDYTKANPVAVFSVGGDELGRRSSSNSKNNIKGIPIGHTYYVSLLLLMPESDFNREIGVFQLTAEILSINGDVMAKSSQPCMLRFQSLPIRLTRTFLMGIPLLLGISDETQKLTVEILRHKEGNQRTGTIRVILSPRAGTQSLPQLYEAEIIFNSQLPWTKNLVHNWKWTFYVWTSLCLYILLLIILIWCCKSVLFPSTTVASFRDQDAGIVEGDELKDHLAQTWMRDEKEITAEFSRIRSWQVRRRKRKAIYLHDDELVPETVTSSGSASSMKISREDTVSTTIVEEEIGDSESSVCLGH